MVLAGNYWSQFGQIDTVPIWDIAVLVNNDDYFSLFPMVGGEQGGVVGYYLYYCFWGSVFVIKPALDFN